MRDKFLDSVAGGQRPLASFVLAARQGGKRDDGDQRSVVQLPSWQADNLNMLSAPEPFPD